MMDFGDSLASNVLTDGAVEAAEAPNRRWSCFMELWNMKEAATELLNAERVIQPMLMMAMEQKWSRDVVAWQSREVFDSKMDVTNGSFTEWEVQGLLDRRFALKKLPGVHAWMKLKGKRLNTEQFLGASMEVIWL